MNCSGLTVENSEEIGFVVACLFSSVIDCSELREWCSDVVIGCCSPDEIPDYIFDLMSFDQPLMHIYKVIGFVPSWEPSAIEDGALYGIATLRGRLPEDAPITSDEAKQMLQMNHYVLDRFRSTFPFIKLDVFWLNN